MTPEMTALVSRCRSRASSHLAMGFLEAGTDLRALAGLVESMDSELQVERARRDLYRREAALACSAAQEALPLALGALEATCRLADKSNPYSIACGGLSRIADLDMNEEFGSDNGGDGWGYEIESKNMRSIAVTTIAKSTLPAEAWRGHLIGLAGIAKTVRAAALRCDSIRPYLPPSPTA